MPLTHFSVTQVRVAATCPRILYFDAEHTRRNGLKQPTLTRIWKSGEGDETTACGSLFHAAVEKFNRQAAGDPAVREVLGTAGGPAAIAQGLLAHAYKQCVNREALSQRTGPQQQAFIAALQRYFGELGEILVHALGVGKPLDEVLDQMFGDKRRRVDVTFQVGPGGEPIHITGILDYVFYDWRTAHNRILDYKLTPARHPANDLFQVCVYALMHHVQHKTEPDVGILYLHPARQMVEKPWEQVHAERHKVFDLLASMREWVRYDEKTGRGLKPPGDPIPCGACRWRDECDARLGPKHEGQQLSHWTDARARQTRAEPDIAVGEPLLLPRQERADDSAGGLPAGPRPGQQAADRLWIGRRMAGGQPVGLPCQSLPTHVTVVGAAGSGKTWLAKVLVEEAILQGVPVLAIDPQGDLVQFVHRRNWDAVPADERDRFDRFWGRVEPRVLTPGSSHGIRVSLSPIRLARDQDLASIPDPRRRAEEREGMLAALVGNLVNLAKSGGEVDSQRTFLLQVCKRLTANGTLDQLNLSAVAAALQEPESVGLEGADAFVKKSERERLARKLNNLLHGPSANLFSGGTPLDMQVLCRPVTPAKVPLNVVYLNALSDDDQKQYFVTALAAEVYRWMVTSAGSAGGARLLFYLDEARDYIPAGARKPPAKEPLTRLFAQGRKYGVACLLCTQSPRSVDYNVFGNCSTKIVGRLESAQDVDRVTEWFAVHGATPAWLRGRQGAEKGTFVARWPEMPTELEGQAFKSRLLYSAHEGAWAPERVEREMRDDLVRQALPTETVPVAGPIHSSSARRHQTTDS